MAVWSTQPLWLLGSLSGLCCTVQNFLGAGLSPHLTYFIWSESVYATVNGIRSGASALVPQELGRSRSVTNNQDLQPICATTPEICQLIISLHE